MKRKTEVDRTRTKESNEIKTGYNKKGKGKERKFKKK